MPSGDQAILLKTPDETAAWRSGLSQAASPVALITGTFEILQPGNLAALQAGTAGGPLVVAVEDDGTAPSQAARGGTLYHLSDRLDSLAFLRFPAAVFSARGNPGPFLKALGAYTWTGCPLPGDGPVAEAARAGASRRTVLPFLPGCRTTDIQAATREGRTPVALPTIYEGQSPAPLPAVPPRATVNGCFDVLHIGHLRFLDQAAQLAGGPVTLLINSDASIRRYKGAGRPVFPFAFRRAALLALRSVADVFAFDEDEPLALLATLKPPLHIKGGSREPDRVRHEEELLARWGGRVAFCPLTSGYSTSAYLDKSRSVVPS